jgi:Zn-dependent protease
VQVGLNWTFMALVALVVVWLARNRFPIEAPGRSGAAYALAGLLTAVGLLVGVLLHELGHAVIARRAGLKVDGITLSWMGGVTRIEGDAVRPRSEFAIAGIGPTVSAGIGGLLWLVHTEAHSLGVGSLVLAAIGWLAAINIVLAIFNVLPAAPLDGGKVMHAAVWAATGDRWKATRIAAGAGIGLGVLLIGLGLVITARHRDPFNGLLIGVLGWWLMASARAELEASGVHRALDGLTMADLMRPVGSAPGWITIRSFAENFAGPRAGWVWLLEGWQGGYDGVLAGDSIGAVPLPQWDFIRPIDLAYPIAATTGAAPSDDALEVLARTAGRQVVLVVEANRTVGAVLPSDVEALLRMGGRGAAVRRAQPAPEGVKP